MFSQGELIFYPCEKHCYLPGTVGEEFSEDSKGVTILNEGHEVVQLETARGVLRRDVQSETDIDDMVKLIDLNEASVLHNLRLRFNKDVIYTQIGSILTAINPFKLLPIYTPEVLDQYRENGSKKNPPHVYGVADDAFKAMIATGQGQSCIVSGESGAGKTETTKLFLQYLAEVSKVDFSKSSDADPEKYVSLQERIMKSNPILESFGNAKTVRNNNSSRFGKWLEMYFAPGTGEMLGGKITCYLLEKSRLVRHNNLERNYHIFYQLCSGAKLDENLKNWLKLSDAENYNYLNKCNEIEIKGINDVADWKDVQNAMKVVNISSEEKRGILETLAGILHLGNIDFCRDDSNKTIDASKVVNSDILTLCASQLGVESEHLERALIMRNMGGRSMIMVPYSVEQAIHARDALAKSLYGQLFDWLVQKINLSLVEKETKNKRIIGVLDIFGFEIFEVNSFEQLCINYCNEKLQLHFNEHIFKLEKKEYELEEIDVTSIDFADNKPCVDIIEQKNTGILAMIDEEINVPKGSDDGFVSKCLRKHQNNTYVQRPSVKLKNAKSCFQISHYAGLVCYTATGFLDKNKNILHDDLQQTMGTTKSSFIAKLLDCTKRNEAETCSNSDRRSRSSKKATKKTLATQFKEQLGALTETLNQTNPHFIRCVKPNAEKSGDIFTSQMIMSQLRYAGLLEVCRIRKIGYPIRLPFETFLERYNCIFPSVGRSLTALVAKLNVGVQVGKTKVFIRTDQHAQLEERRSQALFSVATVIQSIVRRHLYVKRLRTWKKILSDIAKGVEERKFDLLDQGLSKIHELPNGGNHLRMVREAKQFLDKHAEELHVEKLLQKAIGAFDLAALKSSIAVAEKLGLTADSNPVLKRATLALEKVAEATRIRNSLKEAIKSKDIETLSNALKAGTDLGMGEDDDVFREANNLHLRLQKEKNLISELKIALDKSWDEEVISAIVSEMKKMGIAIPENASRAQEIFSKINVSIKNRDVVELDRVLESISPEKCKPKDAVKMLRNLQAQKQLETAMEKRDYDMILSAKENPDLDNKSMLETAEFLIERLREEKNMKEKMNDAIRSGNVELLQNLVGRAAEIGLDIPTEARQMTEMSIKLGEAIATGEVETVKNAIESAKGIVPECELERAYAILENLEAIESCETSEDIEKCISKMSESSKLKDVLRVVRNAEAAMYCKDKATLQKMTENSSLPPKVLLRVQRQLRDISIEEAAEAALSTALKDKDKSKIKSLLCEYEDIDSTSELWKSAKEFLERETSIEESLEQLNTAMADENLDELSASIESLLNMGAESNQDLSEALAMKERLMQAKQECSEIIAEMDVLKNKSIRSVGIKKADITGLKSALKAYDGDRNIYVNSAHALYVKMERQVELQETLENAKDYITIEKTVHEAFQAGFGFLQVVIDAKSSLRKIEGDRRAAKRLALAAGIDYEEDTQDTLEKVYMSNTTEKNESKTLDELSDMNEKKKQRAQNKQYSFQKFHRIRSDEDFGKGVFFGKSKTIKRKLCYQTSTIHKSILETADKDSNKAAINLHKNILGYCGDKSMSFPAILAEDILRKGLGSSDLADEVYVQLCKHLTGNTKAESIGKAWQIMCMITGTFPPSSGFEYYLLNFLLQHTETEGLIGTYARFSLERLLNIMDSGSSGFVPAVEEIQAYNDRPPILATVELVDGTSITENLPVTPDMNVGKVTDICVHFLDLEEDSDLFGIFLVESEESDAFPIRSKDYFGDIYLEAMREKKNVSLVFKQKIFLKLDDNIHMNDENPMFCQLAFLQARDDFLNGKFKNMKNVVDVASYLLAAEEDKMSIGAMKVDDVFFFLPPNSPVSKSEVFNELQSQALSLHSTYSMEELQRMFVDILSKHSRYGMITFQTKDKGEIGIDSDGFHFLEHPESTYGFNEMYRWSNGPSQFSLVVFNGEKNDTSVVNIEVDNAKYISGLVLDYCNHIMANINE